MWKETSAEPLRSDSMGIDIQIYLTEVPLPSTLPCPSFSRTLIFSLSLSPSFSSLRVFFPQRKPLHVTGASYRGLARARGKKNLHLDRFFSPSAVDTRGLDLERKLRRQMRASARGNCSSSIFRAAFPSPEDLDLEKRETVSRYKILRCEHESWSRYNAPVCADFIEMRYGNYSDLIGLTIGQVVHISYFSIYSMIILFFTLRMFIHKTITNQGSII